MAAFLNRSYFCPDCCKGFNTDEAASHSCMGRSCSSCQRTRSQKNTGGCPDFKPAKLRTIHCKDCQRDFYGTDCFKAHKEAKGKKKMSLCQTLKKCLSCCKGYKVNPKKPHECYHDTCRHCHQFVEIYKHKCYIQRVIDVKEEEDKDDDKDKKPPPLMVFADIECLIEKDDKGREVLVADLIRFASEEDPSDTSHMFGGETCIQQFIQAMNELTKVEDKKRDLFVIFHNLKGFDSNFIVEELYRQGVKVENQLTMGAKTLKFQYWFLNATITFKDSLCFLPMPLAELPQTFNFVELHKGFFPHKFHTRVNWSYKGSLPAKQYFQPEAMKQKKRQEFDTWYAAQVEKKELYDLWEELNKYCHSDVMVLKAACLKFIQEFQDEAGFDPMEKCATIASACNLFWRKELIPENTIAIEPLNGWRGANVNQSTSALEWLCFEDFKLGGNKLRHVRNGGEQKVFTQDEALFVDGFDPDTNTVYEYNGCFYHGCVKCFPNQRYRKHNCHQDRTIAEVYEATCKKSQKLRQAGYTVIEKWEHDFEMEKNTSPSLMEFLKTFQLSEPLNPGDSFFGGRTNGVRLHCATKAGEEIRYVDINSL